MARAVTLMSGHRRALPRRLSGMLALVAVLFAALLPGVVAASPAMGSPMVLCSGGEMRVIYVDDQGQPVDHGEQASLKCALALLSGLAAAPAAQPDLLVEPAEFTAVAVFVRTTVQDHRPARAPPRPPSTAPPLA